MRLKTILLLLSSLAAASPCLAAEQQSMDPRFAPQPTEEACRSLTLASTGGPMVKDPNILLVRWLGFSTYELIHGGQKPALQLLANCGGRRRQFVVPQLGGQVE